MESAQSICDATLDCQRAFRECLSVPELCINNWIENRLGDFNLWASSLRAAEISHASLDYRLRERKDAREVIESLLQCLQSSLKQCYEISQGHAENHEDPEIAQDDSDESFGSWSDLSQGEDESDTEIDQYQPWVGTHFYEEIQSIAAILDQLSRLGMAIRRAGTQFRYANADRSLKKDEHAEFENYLRVILLYDSRKHQFVSHASYKLPVLAIVSKAFFLDPGRLTPIQKRIIHANIVRRNRLDYMRKREERFSGISQVKVDQKKKMPPKASFTPHPKLATPEAKEIIKAPEPSINQSATQVESQFAPGGTPLPRKKAMIAASSKISTTAARVPYPKAPKIEDGRETFQCPYCLHALSREYAAEKEWKRHVSRDLLPYTCMFEDCQMPNELYLSKDEWVKHLHNSHSLKQWKCPFSGINAACAMNPLFPTENEWITHMETCHGNQKAFAPAQLRVLAKTNITRELPPYHCPICPPHLRDKPHSIDDVAAHLHSFALGALPWIGDPNDKESKATGASGTSSKDSIHNDTISKFFNGLLKRLSSMTNYDKVIRPILLDLQDWNRDIHTKAPGSFEMIQEDGGELASKINACFVEIAYSLDEIEEKSLASSESPSSETTREKHPQLRQSVGNLTEIKGAILVFMDELFKKRAMDTTRALLLQLMDARIEDPYVSHRFYIPRQAQHELVTERNVATILYTQIQDRLVLTETAKLIFQRGSAIFAILVLIRKQAAIQYFLDEGILDASLPLQRVNGTEHFSLQTKHGRRVNSVTGWNSECREKFDCIQWWFLAPIFKDLDHYELGENVMLPTVPFLPEDKESSLDSGGYSEVYPVRIHHKHHRWSAVADPESNGPLVAIRQLTQSEEEGFKREQDILIRLTGHPHLIKLLSTFQQGGKWHLMFPFADSNLRTYWEIRSLPVFDQDTVQWVLKQMVGITSALARIHSFIGTFAQSIPGAVEVAAGNIFQVQDLEELYGLHGDIKPESFLWFQNAPGVDDPMGIIQLAGFGLGRFHDRDSRSRKHASTVPFSPTYEPPECKIGRSISRVYDIWSLGCVHLEFVTWLVLGSREIGAFSEHRGEWSEETLINDDNFYSITSDNEAIVRPKVCSWVEKLHGHERSSQVIHDLLHLIMGHMIVVEPRDRIKSKELQEELSELLRKAANDRDYALRSVPH